MAETEVVVHEEEEESNDDAGNEEIEQQKIDPKQQSPWSKLFQPPN